ncbi:metallophosphatase family protein [Caballeronia novacaledonica]|uniref:metallophosphoesterase family protein n=1 Tax=Caballeronia novacaledonica TaxID=1544861 RepID=UPI001EE34E5B|nr:metallophosphatase family protein [Caballeronia novacaledonica]GJH14751.1 metallophosphatase family protein [Caballeronia novacaledonica]
MKIAHFSDLHYAPENVEEADRCFGFAIDHAVLAHSDVAVISGDATDHRLDAHAPSLNRLARRINGLSGSMPVLMLQGTFSHEPPGTLRNFELMATTHQIYVAERVQQVSLHEGRFYASAGPVYSEEELREVLAIGADVVFTCLPTVSKGQLAAAVGAKEAGTGLEAVLGDYLAAAGGVNQQLRAAGIRTVGVSHGTVNGCTTEHGVTMAGFDHEFSLGSLFDAECDAFMLGHIHKAQQWERAGLVVAYPGSIGRFHYGEEGDKGFLMWNVEVGSAQADLIVTPSRQTICVDFDGPPDMQSLTAIALDATDKFVRIRWQVDEEHKQSVDRDAIAALFGNAAELKVEARILPVVRSRAQGISLETSIDRKLDRWCEHTAVDPVPLLDRLQLLETGDTEAIAAGVLARLSDADPAHPFAKNELPALSSMPEPVPVAVQEGPSDNVSDGALPMPDATVEIVESASASQLSWLNDDLFAA